MDRSTMDANQDLESRKTEWIHRFVIFVTVSKQVTANDLWGKGSTKIDPDTGGERTFDSILLSSTGKKPASHIACETAAIETMKTKITMAISSAALMVYDMSKGWTFETAMKDMGLKLIMEASEPDEPLVGKS